MEFHRRAFSNRRSNRGRPREPPWNTTGWITGASTAGAFASRRDACSYACWHCRKSFLRRNANNRSDAAHLAAITTGPALSELVGPRLYTKEILSDTADETYGADSAIEYTYATTIVQSCSAGENAEIFPFKEAMTLPVKAQRKEALHKEEPEKEQRLHPPASDL